MSKTAAENGNAHAQNEMGYIYRNGEGVPKDAQKAFYWFSK